MNKIRRLFEKNGFVLIRGALSQKETLLLKIIFELNLNRKIPMI